VTKSQGRRDKEKRSALRQRLRRRGWSEWDIAQVDTELLARQQAKRHAATNRVATQDQVWRQPTTGPILVKSVWTNNVGRGKRSR
jgi:hypothetical protein